MTEAWKMPKMPGVVVWWPLFLFGISVVGVGFVLQYRVEAQEEELAHLAHGAKIDHDTLITIESEMGHVKDTVKEIQTAQKAQTVQLQGHLRGIELQLERLVITLDRHDPVL